jgi:hypothetical protein
MNEIRVRRMFLAALAMFVVWIAVEILVEHVLSRLLFGETSAQMWLQVIDISRWSAMNSAVNVVLAIANCSILIWLYASLRPMYGVGARTALIASAFGIAWVLSIFVTLMNLGLIPLRLGLIEAAFEAVEFPIAMLVGAGVYEDRENAVPEPGSRGLPG